MKFLYLFILFLFSFSLTFCNPFSLDDDGRGRKRDSARGEGRFKLPEIKDIDLDEIKKKSFLENCHDYNDAGCFSLLGQISPARPVCNCIAKSVDEGLKPLCEYEDDLEEALEYYEDKRDDDQVEEIKEHLLEVEEAKYEIADELYAMADEFDEVKGDVLDEIDDHYDKKEEEKDDHGLTIGQTLLKGLTKSVTRSEFGGLVRVLDSRARIACRNPIDFSKIKRRRR